MERLTDEVLHNAIKTYEITSKIDDPDYSAVLNKCILEFLHELKAYRDAEEQGLLIRLPCKVGDDVWTIMCGMTGKHPALFRQEFTLSMFSHFGTAVFLTKEEAEVALERMSEKENENE